ncbi:MAG: crossover junction endodeoxyribonuclease RuvC [Chloroflexi bacterium]|nr:crossover junction endodeoxyribonuclease RuvC [Chloroflexota bacterium]
MRVLGVDPGTVSMGYGLIEENGQQLRMLDCGVLSAPTRKPPPERLYELYLGLLDILADSQPQEIAIEEPFVAQNIRSALAIGRAQAVAMLAATNKGIPIYTYPPAKVKQMVTNYGGSSKGQVQHMVCLQLGLAQSSPPSDATDALAIALCHLRERQLATVLARGNRQP